MNTIYKDFYNSKQDYAVIIETSGMVCYAYLLKNKKIITHVWLYNALFKEKDTDLSSYNDCPPMNTFKHVQMLNIDSLTNTDFQVEWQREESPVCADIYIRNEIVARFVEGAKPGYSKFALEDSPFAKKWI
jgi:hypothetical protein